jgi:hypothetical protein
MDISFGLLLEGVFWEGTASGFLVKLCQLYL